MTSRGGGSNVDNLYLLYVELLYLSLLSRTVPTTRGERRTTWQPGGPGRLGGCERTRLPWELPTWREKTPGWGRRWRPVSQTWPGWPVWGTSWDRGFLSTNEQTMLCIVLVYVLFDHHTRTTIPESSCTNFTEYFRPKNLRHGRKSRDDDPQASREGWPAELHLWWGWWWEL